MSTPYSWEGGPDGFRAHDAAEGPVYAVAQVVWTTQRSTPFLADAAVAAELADALQSAAAEVGSRVERLLTGPTWVAVTVRVPYDVTLRDVVWRLKRRSASRLRRAFPHVERLGAAWTRRSLVTTAPPVADAPLVAVAEAFVADERKRKRPARPIGPDSRG